MGNRQSQASIEFINNSECPKVEVTVGNQKKVLTSKGQIAKFLIFDATPSTVRSYEQSGRPSNEVKITLGTTAASQVWKITNSGVKHKRSPFFTETHSWTTRFN